MRREGYMHGAHVRLSRKELGLGERAPRKPTNHSKITARCPSNCVGCTQCSRGLPVKKSIGKVKGAFKAADLDVTRNYKMSEWRLYEKHGWEPDYCSDLSEKLACSWGEAEAWEDASRSSRMLLSIESLLRTQRPPKPLISDSQLESASDKDDRCLVADFSDGDDYCGDDWVLVAQVL